MLVVNENLYRDNGIYNFINSSIQVILSQNPALRSRSEYLLFYFVKEDFYASLSSIRNTDINLDFLGFPVIRRNIRHAIESYLDLWNLTVDQEYIGVLNYCANNTKYYTGKYQNYLYKGQFTIQSKYNIAASYGMDWEKLMKISIDCNKYTHPNIFILASNEQDTKKEILKELLETSLELLNGAYFLILKSFNNNIQPYVGCLNCQQTHCNQCYNRLFNEFSNCINTNLLLEFYPHQYFYGG